MKQLLYTLLIILEVLLVAPCGAEAKSLPDSCRTNISALLTRMIDREVWGGTARITNYSIRGRRLRLNATIGLSNYPFREESVEAIYDSIRCLLPASLRGYRLELTTDGHLIEELIPLASRRKFDRRKQIPFTNSAAYPLVRKESPSGPFDRGLQERHIALWQSHGRYFEQSENRWRWQRTVHWQTREDLFTQSFVLPYLVPMLEHAGAYVFLPRERDTQLHELLLDGDHGDESYREVNGRERWEHGGQGFAWQSPVLLAGDNPFKGGLCRMVQTTTRPAEVSLAHWQASIPESGEYALYISYRSHERCAADARYTVHHAGGESHFRVNQQLGGGTWIYLGTFPFEAGDERVVVTLSNLSDKAGQLVVADAVRLGGGIGNVARTVCDSLRREGVDYSPRLSGLPRYMEGARYWLQWAGFSEEVYAPKAGTDDYKEDYMSRAHWVNALMGGSQRLPEEPGLGIPIDMALAFHSDSGVRDSDETIGTLGIFFTQENKGLFEGGASRYRSRDLTDLIMTEIVGDIRSEMEPTWRRRGLWNRSYYEARVPAAPTMLLELLSHQNFADMRYGHDPRFKFLVSRSIYKGILKHIAAQYGYDYVVQPLPVSRFRVDLQGEKALLNWAPRSDEKEPTAKPDFYLLQTSIDGSAFDAGRKVEGCSFKFDLAPDHLYRFRVVACNRGGESFPSEVLAAGVASEEQGRILVANLFTRLAAPPSFRSEQEAGFCQDDMGVPHHCDITFTGAQYEYDRSRINGENSSTMLGASYEDCEGIIRRGNSFDYPALHGRAILAAGYSFASTSREALVEKGVEGYAALDLILGEQRSTLLARGVRGWEFSCFDAPLQELLDGYLMQGGRLFLSGSYIASDLWVSECSGEAQRRFARERLHYEYQASAATSQGRLRPLSALLPLSAMRFNQQEHPTLYAAESPDAIRPVGEGAFPLLAYTENGHTAAVAYFGEGYRTVSLAFPFETILEECDRLSTMQRILEFLLND